MYANINFPTWFATTWFFPVIIIVLFYEILLHNTCRWIKCTSYCWHSSGRISFYFVCYSNNNNNNYYYYYIYYERKKKELQTIDVIDWHKLFVVCILVCLLVETLVVLFLLFVLETGLLVKVGNYTKESLYLL